MRKCIDCKVEKSLEEFPVNSGQYRRTRCAPCYTIYNTTVRRNWYSAEKERDSKLQKKYGITFEQYTAMLAAQGGVCGICGNPETRMRDGSISLLAVDHCHSTGRVRGLLCFRCNMMIGYAKDNVDTLINAIEYLGEAE